MTEPLPANSVIGILGGGQLGRMLSVAAARLGYRTVIFEPGQTPPAGQVAEEVITANYSDMNALRDFAERVDCITYEFENIPAEALDMLCEIKDVAPPRRALSISQDRLVEKTFLTELGLKTAPFRDVSSEESLRIAADEIGLPAILKTRRLGYDGKGQARLKTPNDIADAWAEMAGADAILEGFVNFEREISVIAARNILGQISCYDPGENIHEDGILRHTRVPARISHSLATDAALLAGRILNALDYVGVLGVELFVTKNGLIVNEIAPRVHNSGHWTQNGCMTDQFEQHIRAITGLPLGDGSRFADVEMHNILGSEVEALTHYLQNPRAAIHLYGKAAVKSGRKMGHVNIMNGP